jgi:3-dehydro-L-gulonate 2-dehydrogenase
MLRVPYGDLLDTLIHALLKLGFETQRARLCARLFAEATCDGVYSHGVNRFPLFVSTIRNGIVHVDAEPALLSSSGPLERWDGRSGPGNLNAWFSMEKAITLARRHGVSCVALANTNHWMRGGTYGWQAADAAMIGMCWTNTLPNLPPWGASTPRLGNNPFVLAVPRPGGHVVLDMAMSQFSYGALASYRKLGELLPVEGGFDTNGQLTRVPQEIEASMRPLPIGYWKGSGLALMLDLIAATLAGGKATHEIEAGPERETGLSQIFIALDPSRVDGASAAASQIAERVIQDLQSSFSPEEVRYPGQETLRVRKENLAQGVPVEPDIWRELKQMSGSA